MNQMMRVFFSTNGSILSTVILGVVLNCFAVSSFAQITYKKARDGKVTEIRNGKIGIAIPTSESYARDESKTLSPLQYFIYPDGKISDTSANYLQIQYPRMGGSGPLSLSVNWKSQKPDLCEVEIRYTFRKGRFELYGKTYPGGDAGSGYYSCTIRMNKGEKSILVEDAYDYEISHSVGLSAGLEPDQLRYRGWLSDAEANGYEKKGQKYRSEHERGFPMDATLDISYEARAKAFPLSIWQPAGGEINTGRYWMAYQSGANSTANMFGLFQGSAAVMNGATGVSVNLLSSQENLDGRLLKKLDLSIGLERRGPDDSWFPFRKQQWAVYLATKADILPAEKIQPIALEMNRVSGLARDIDHYAEKQAVIIPGFYAGAIFNSPERVQAMILKAQTNQDFYAYLCNTDSYYKPVFDAWRSAAEEKKLVQELLSFAQSVRENYKSGEGIFREDIRYWKGANVFKLKAISIACLLANPKNQITAEEKKQLESLVRMMARILWDERNAPMADGSGANLGTANMPTQYLNSRFFFALLFAKDPEFSKRANAVNKMVRENLLNNIYSSGASFGTPHYIQPAIEPILFTVLQLKQAGVSDLFREEARLKKFALFYLSLLTPPSPRFAGNRKLISFGDGSEESAVLFSLLGSGFEDIDPKLAGSLHTAFHYGPPRMSLFGPVFLAGSLADPGKNMMQLGSSSFPGYTSNLLSESGTTSLWMLNGDSLFDHRNDDRGEIAIYALGAPLSVSRSSFYYPHATDARIRTMVVPFSMFPEWNAELKTISERSMKPGTWQQSTHQEFFAMPLLKGTTSVMINTEGQWRRKVLMIDVWKNKPVFVLLDSLTGPGEQVWSMMMFSEGAIQTPVGKLEPEKRVHNNGDKQELPRSTPARPLSPGLHRFSFTGQPMNKAFHEGGGINWDLYAIADKPMSFGLSQWTTTWQNTAEKDDYQRSFQRPYEEGQQILRMKGNSGFFTVLIPSLKTEKEPAMLTRIQPDLYVVPNGKDSMMISSAGYWCSMGESQVLSSFGQKPLRFRGFGIEGGHAELVVEKKQVLIRVQGVMGKRTIQLPFAAQLGADSKDLILTKKGSQTILTIDYRGSALQVLPTEKGYTEYRVSRE